MLLPVTLPLCLPFSVALCLRVPLAFRAAGRSHTEPPSHKEEYRVEARNRTGNPIFCPPFFCHLLNPIQRDRANEIAFRCAYLSLWLCDSVCHSHSAPLEDLTQSHQATEEYRIETGKQKGNRILLPPFFCHFLNPVQRDRAHSIAFLCACLSLWLCASVCHSHSAPLEDLTQSHQATEKSTESKLGSKTAIQFFALHFSAIF